MAQKSTAKILVLDEVKGVMEVQYNDLPPIAIELPAIPVDEAGLLELLNRFAPNEQKIRRHTARGTNRNWDVVKSKMGKGILVERPADNADTVIKPESVIQVHRDVTA